MTTVEFLNELQRRDIQVRAEGDRLRCNAPTGALTPELQDEMRRRKAEILEFLRTAQSLTRQQPAIVPLQPAGTRIPIFAVPGHNGDVFCYRHLARALGEDQPFFGLQPLGLDEKSSAMERIEDIADYFATQIREASAGKPCVIVGFCAGGAVALELAQRLRQQDHPVPLLALFGTPFPTMYHRLPQLRAKVLHQLQRVFSHLRSVTRGGLSAGLARLKNGIRRRQAEAQKEREKSADPVLALRRKVEEATMKAVMRYLPRHYDGHVCLFLPSDEWLRVGSTSAQWRSIAKQMREEVGPADCNGDIMLRERHVDFFAALLRKHCAGVGASL